MSLKDKNIACRDCGGEFTFTAGEQEFYAQKGFTNEPTRCPLGRRARKDSSSLVSLAGGTSCPHDLSGRGQIREDAGADRPRRSRDDGYSSGMSGGHGYGSERGYGGQRGYGERPRRDRQSYDGPLPSGVVPATVVRVDPNGRFMFVRVENPGVDVFVHNSFFNRLRNVPREGEEVRITVEASERGPRASSFDV